MQLWAQDFYKKTETWRKTVKETGPAVPNVSLRSCDAPQEKYRASLGDDFDQLYLWLLVSLCNYCYFLSFYCGFSKCICTLQMLFSSAERIQTNKQKTKSKAQPQSTYYSQLYIQKAERKWSWPCFHGVSSEPSNPTNACYCLHTYPGKHTPASNKPRFLGSWRKCFANRVWPPNCLPYEWFTLKWKKKYH